MVCSIEELDKDRRKGKDRRVCLRSGIYSIPCRASCWALDDLNNRMNCTMTLRKERLNSSSNPQNRPIGKTAIMARNSMNSAPPNSSDDLCLCFCICPSFMVCNLEVLSKTLGFRKKLPVTTSKNTVPRCLINGDQLSGSN